MANTFLPAAAPGANVSPSVIGPQGMKPVGGGGGQQQQMTGQLGQLAQALMLAKMRAGQHPIALQNQFAPGAAPQMPPQPQPMNMDPMSGGAGPQLA